MYSPDAFNRIARQQGLEQLLAKAVIFDEICQAIDLPSDLEAKMLDHYWQQANVVDPEDQQRYLQAEAGAATTSSFTPHGLNV